MENVLHSQSGFKYGRNNLFIFEAYAANGNSLLSSDVKEVHVTSNIYLKKSKIKNLCLSRSSRSYQHETVAYNSCLKQLDTFVQETRHIFNSQLQACALETCVQCAIIYSLLSENFFLCF